MGLEEKIALYTIGMLSILTSVGLLFYRNDEQRSRIIIGKWSVDLSAPALVVLVCGMVLTLSPLYVALNPVPYDGPMVLTEIKTVPIYPPEPLLSCRDEPPVPPEEGLSDRDVMIYIADLKHAGAECRLRLQGVREYVQAVKANYEESGSE